MAVNFSRRQETKYPGGKHLKTANQHIPEVKPHPGIRDEGRILTGTDIIKTPCLKQSRQTIKALAQSAT